MNFLTLLCSHLFLPHITQPTRIRDSSKTLIDNIFSHQWIENTKSGNLTATLSDHLPQFVMLPNIFSNPLSNKSNIYERNWSNFFQENFILDYFTVGRNSLINNDKDVNLSFNIFLRESMHPLGKSQKRN